MRKQKQKHFLYQTFGQPKNISKVPNPILLRNFPEKNPNMCKNCSKIGKNRNKMGLNNMVRDCIKKSFTLPPKFVKPYHAEHLLYFQL